MANPAVLAKFQNPGPVANAFLIEWLKFFKDSKYVGHSAGKTGSTAYAKFSVPSVNKYKLCKVPVRVKYHSRNPSKIMICDEVWEAWAKLRIEKVEDVSKKSRMFNDWTRNYTNDTSLSQLFAEVGASSHQELYEAFFEAVEFFPELNKAVKDVANSSCVEEKKKSHEIKCALSDIRGPLRTLLKHGIETDKLHEMINIEIMDLVTNG